MTSAQQSFDFGSGGDTDPASGRPEGSAQLLFRAPSSDTDEAARLALEARLGQLLSENVVVKVTDNRHTMISSRRRSGRFLLRLHHMFLDADDATVRALARYLTRTDRRASARLDEYIDAKSHLIRREGRKRRRLRTRGEHHDLQRIFDALNEAHFDDGVGVNVTWGRRSPRKSRRRRSIRLGTYVGEDRLIRIHPVLDAAWVPSFFLSYVVFHEMLHAVIPAPVQNGRQRFHCAEFRARERAYPDFERAIHWERQNLRRLLTS
jgi:hypothetical protein